MPEISKPKFPQNYVTVTAKESGETLLDVDKSLVQDLYKTYGAVLFRGFALDTNAFRSLVGIYCTHAVFNESGGREIVDEDQVIQTVNTGSLSFPLPPELSREPWKPDVCWFGCLTPPLSGGETTICDGTRIVRKLPKKVRRELENRRLLYRRTTTPEEVSYWLGIENFTDAELRNPPEDCPFAFEMDDGQLTRSFTVPVLHKPMFSDETCFGNFLIFSRFMNNNYAYPTFDDGAPVPKDLTDWVKRVGDSCTVPVKWKANDVLMLDNTRFMHGRREIKDTNHRYILTYFGFLNFAVPGAEEGANPRWRNPAMWHDVKLEQSSQASQASSGRATEIAAV